MPVPKKTNILRVIFFTIFLDIVGFSIIFPLYPAMLEFYMGQGDSGLFGLAVTAVNGLESALGIEGDASTIVLFGGLLGALYSLLQFLCAPIIGALSDRYGRRPVLLIAVAGTALSYAIWVCAGSFELLIVSRLLGGIMSGNISTASAAIADITSERDRARGMATIGIAFGTGMTLGPLLGLAARIDLTNIYPNLAGLGINPFSVPALLAFALAMANLLFLAVSFPETRRFTEGSARSKRLINPVKMFQTVPVPGVRTTNLANFLFLTAMSGMEFSLTFLAAERMGYGPARNGAMLAFVGLALAATQGGYVRRRSTVVGPKRMALHGMVLMIPALCVLGFAYSSWLLYAGLLLLSVGAAQVIPCLMGLVSAYAKPEEQGSAMGVFRSVSALARVIGPLAACVVYWRLGSATAYISAAAFLLMPILLVRSLPSAPERRD